MVCINEQLQYICCLLYIAVRQSGAKNGDIPRPGCQFSPQLRRCQFQQPASRGCDVMALTHSS